jgi:transcriptional regulator with XRE-family HTH domain
MIDMKRIGERIRKQRGDRALTQEQLAEMLGISTEYMSKIETGKVVINLKRLAEISGLLDCPIEYLVAGTAIKAADYKLDEAQQLMQSFTPEKRTAAIEIMKIIRDLP